MNRPLAELAQMRAGSTVGTNDQEAEYLRKSIFASMQEELWALDRAHYESA